MGTQEKIVTLAADEIGCIILALERMNKEIELDNDSYMTRTKEIVQSALRKLLT